MNNKTPRDIKGLSLDMFGEMFDPIQLFKNHIQYRPQFTAITGTPNTSLLLSRILNYSEYMESENPETMGWFFRHQEEFAIEIEVSLSTVKRSFARLVELGILETFTASPGRGYRPLTHYRVNRAKLRILILAYAIGEQSRSAQQKKETRLAEIRKTYARDREEIKRPGAVTPWLNEDIPGGQFERDLQILGVHHPLFQQRYLNGGADISNPPPSEETTKEEIEELGREYRERVYSKNQTQKGQNDTPSKHWAREEKLPANPHSSKECQNDTSKECQNDTSLNSRNTTTTTNKEIVSRFEKITCLEHLIDQSELTVQTLISEGELPEGVRKPTRSAIRKKAESLWERFGVRADPFIVAEDVIETRIINHTKRQAKLTRAAGNPERRQPTTAEMMDTTWADRFDFDFD